MSTFYESTPEDLTGQVIHRVNLHVHDIDQITEKTCNNIELTVLNASKNP